MHSIWENSTKLPSFVHLSKDIKTDVLIIGGGICGILCACMLKETGTDYVLVEADRICSGITKNTTAKITSQHGLIFDKLIKKFGIETTRMYLEANEAALSQFRKLSKTISCNFENKDSFVYSINNPKKIEKELNALGRIGFNALVFSPSRTMLRTQLFINAFEATANLLTPSKKRCPHLGCALKWNPKEHSWDCPCHGSRFTKDGKLIDNPATGNLKQ